jgi:hypothetical protein
MVIPTLSTFATSVVVVVATTAAFAWKLLSRPLNVAIVVIVGKWSFGPIVIVTIAPLTWKGTIRTGVGVVVVVVTKNSIFVEWLSTRHITTFA